MLLIYSWYLNDILHKCSNLIWFKHISNGFSSFHCSHFFCSTSYIKLQVWLMSCFLLYCIYILFMLSAHKQQDFVAFASDIQTCTSSLLSYILFCKEFLYVPFLFIIIIIIIIITISCKHCVYFDLSVFQCTCTTEVTINMLNLECVIAKSDNRCFF